MGTRAFELTGARKRYAPGRPEVLRGIDLHADAGEFLVILGRSGSGKSTVLRALAGLESLDAGTVTWAGTDATPRLGVVFQQPLLLPWATVAENIALGGRFAANRDGFDPRFARELLGRFGLGDLAGAYPDELSGGQAQRIAVIRAVAVRPQALLLDEPFSALDEFKREHLGLEFTRMHEEMGRTTLLVTHSIPEAVLMADRIICLDANPGRVAADIRVDLPRPRSAAMIGTSRFMEISQEVREALVGEDGSIA